MTKTTKAILPSEDALDWREAIDSAVESCRKGDISEWELDLITRRVEAAIRAASQGRVG